MKLKKVMGVVLTAATALTLLSGCSETKVEPTQAPTAKAAEAGSTEVGSTEAESTTAKENGEAVELDIAIFSDDKPMLEEIAALYNQDHPNVKLNLIECAPDDYLEKIIVQLAGGQDIDLVWSGNNVAYSDFVAKDLLLPLDDYIKRDSIDVSGYGPTYESMKIDGKISLMPVRNSEWVLYYNKDLFDAAGVEYPKGSMSYEEFRELAKKMTKGEGTEKIWGGYIHTWPISWTRYAIQGGSTIIDEDLTPFTKALQYRLDLESDGSVMPYTEQKATTAHYKSAFLKGNVAMHIMGDFHIGQLRAAEATKELTFDWDIAASPIPDGASPNTTTGMPAGFEISKKSKNPEEAWDFLSYVSGVEGAKVYAKAGFVPSYLNDDVRSIISYDGVTKPEHVGILLEQKVYAEYPAVSGIGQVDKIYDEESQLVFAGEKTPEEAIEKIGKRIDELNLMQQ